MEPSGPLRPGMHFIKGDLRSASTVRRACRGAHVVFHMGSYGMSGPSQMDRALIRSINIGGARNVISACLEEGVGRLVYTSTYNVCFGGQPIHGGDESTPLFPPERHVDDYSRTKCVAETMVLEADGRPLSTYGPTTHASGLAGATTSAAATPRPGSSAWHAGSHAGSQSASPTPQAKLCAQVCDPLTIRTTRSGRIYSPAPARRPHTQSIESGHAGAVQAGGSCRGGMAGVRGSMGLLRTCALRPAAIWGPGEQRHCRRLVDALEKGAVLFVWGGADVLVDWLHVDNLVAAHLLAAEALAAPGCPAGGQAYFISDGNPVNNFEFLRPMWEGLGYKMPRVRLPTALVFQLARMLEALHPLLCHVTSLSPLLLPAEVYKCGVTHYCRIDKARRELGYQPMRRSVHEMADWWRERGHGRRAKVHTSLAMKVWVLATTFLVITLLGFNQTLVRWQ